MYKIFLSNDGNHDATDFYVKIINDGIKRAKKDCVIINDLSNSTKNDIFVVIRFKDFLKVKMRFFTAKIIFWFQGVIPEEAAYTFANKFLKKNFKVFYNTILEKYILENSYKIFFVSKEMLLHYKNKYHFNKNNFFIMPCFNQNLNENYFKNTKYQKPTFVYAGNLNKWQCFEKTVEIFSEIKKVLHNAEFTVLTADIKLAKEVLSRHNLVEVSVYSVPYEKLNEELGKFKYGFLIRDNLVLNNVATPTKMNSYIACGVIPIYSDVIRDFTKVFLGHKYALVYNNTSELIKKIIRLENQTISSEDILKDFKSIFDVYYNRELYITKIAKFMDM